MSARAGKTEGSSTADVGGETFDRGFLLNVCLFVLLALAATLWLKYHLRFLDRGVLIGGGLTVWGLVQLVAAWFKRGAGKRADELIPRLLASPGARVQLVAGLVLLGLLSAVTSSVYVVYEATPGAAPAYRVEVLRYGNRYVEPLEVSSTDRIAGSPFFFSGWRELSFAVIEPRGFTLPARSLCPWESLSIEVPEDLVPRRLRVFHAVAGDPIVEQLPLPSEPPAENADREGPPWFELRVAVGSEQYRWTDLRRNGVYLGAAEEDLRWFVERQSAADAERPAMALRLEPFADQREWLIEQWLADPQLLDTGELRAGQRVVFELLKRGLEPPVACAAETVPEESGVHVVFLDPKECA